VRHVCYGFIAKLANFSAAPAAGAVDVALRDGATGAGTVLIQHRMAFEAVAGKDGPALVLLGLHIPGSANTAMTVEFNGGVTGLYQSVTLLYYDR
jgi:hypothetical protein